MSDNHTKEFMTTVNLIIDCPILHVMRMPQDWIVLHVNWPSWLF